MPVGLGAKAGATFTPKKKKKKGLGLGAKAGPAFSPTPQPAPQPAPQPRPVLAPPFTEIQVRNAGIGYFRNTGTLPSPEKLLLALMGSGDTPKTAEDYAQFWQGIREAKDPGAKAGDFFQDTGYQNLHGVAQLALPSKGGPVYISPNDPSLRPHDMRPQVDPEKVMRDFGIITSMKEKRGFEVTDALNKNNPEAQAVWLSAILANRLRRRGAAVEWDTDHPFQDPDFFNATKKYVIGRQFAFVLWGDVSQKAKANRIINMMRESPYGRAQLEKVAEQVGVEGADWSDQDTVATVLDAMRSTDNEMVSNIVYDGWMFGRPVGQSPSQARYEFANKFGINRLPLKEQDKYRQSSDTVMGALNSMTARADEIWEEGKKLPVVGYNLAALGWALGNLNKVFLPLVTEPFRSLVAVYDMLLMADPSRKMGIAEYQKEMGKRGGWGEDAQGPDWADYTTRLLTPPAILGPKEYIQLADYNWSIFLDASRWAQAREESQGRDPFTTLIQNYSLSIDGKIPPWAEDAGTLAYFSAMMWVGGKMDPVVRGGVKMTADAAFKAGRAAEKAARARKAPRPREAAPEEPGVKVSEQGVRVREVEVEGKPVDVDASAADNMQWLNDNGFVTWQSHGLAKDHPAGYKPRAAEPYAEFRQVDLGKTRAARDAMAGAIRAAADRAKVVVEQGKDTSTKPEHPTIIVKGDIDGFVNELRTARSSEGKPPVVEPPEIPPEGPLAPSERGGNPLDIKLFRTNAEVMAAVDSPETIGWLYQLGDDAPELKVMARKIAKATDPDEVEGLLKVLRDEHHIDIDGGAGAFIKNTRQAAYRRGIGHRSPARLFITPQTYGKRHDTENSSEMTFNVAAATKMGREGALGKDGWGRVRYWRNRMWEADSPNDKAKVLDEMWDEVEKNLGPEGVARYKKYEHRWYAAEGRSFLAFRGSAYMGTMMAGGPAEKSRVVVRGRYRKAVQDDVDQAKAELAGLTDDATPQEQAALKQAVKTAERRAAKIANAYETNARLSAKATLTQAEVGKLEKARADLDEIATSVPFKMGQSRSHLTHRYNPRIMAWYMSGPAGRTWGLVDQAVVNPVMKMFKETVMAALGFPIRVNIGDELVRLIPEGTIGRLRTVRKMKRELEEQGLWGEKLKAELHDRLAYDWASGDTGEWVLATKNTHPRYFNYLKADLQAWGREPIVQRIIARNNGAFPDEVGDVRRLIRLMAKEDSEDGAALRLFLEDTHRGKGTKTPEFEQWVNDWQEQMEAIAGNPTLRRAVTEDVPVSELADLPDSALWPVNAPAEMMSGGFSNPLYSVTKLNPFHYVYNGATIRGRTIPGTVNLLGGISNLMRDTVFSDAYYLERAALLKRGKMDPLEIHNIAKQRAMSYTNKVTYSRSATVAEDMARNLLPFVSAYRQFWGYWLKAYAKHPVAISVAAEEYPVDKLVQDAPFMPMGDYQAYIPGVPFWTLNDEGEGGDMTTWQRGLSQLPMAGMFVTGGLRTLMGALNMDASRYADLPFLGGLEMAPFSRHGKLLYGVFGDPWASLMGKEPLTTLFGDPQKLEKAHINALLGQAAYSGGTGEGGIQRDKPWWWVFGPRSEVFFGEIMKTVSPVTLTYNPEPVRQKMNWKFEYDEAERNGDTQKMAEIRAQNPWFDRFVAFYDALPAEQVAMKRDPANADMLKFWVSPYNYGRSGQILDGRDWQEQFTSGRIPYKSEEAYLNDIHNMYTDVHGGTYRAGEGRAEGTQYGGDVARSKAELNAQHKANAALEWAQGVAKYAAKTRGWDYGTMMDQFQNPTRGWGIWKRTLEMNGKNPNEYNIEMIGKVFAAKYGDRYKLNPQYLSGPEALRAIGLSKWVADPKLAKQLLRETPFASDVMASKREQRNAVMKGVLDAYALENWYWIGSQQLEVVGIDASTKLDALQLDLNAEYRAMQKLTPGTDEYKAARTAYYQHREGAFRSVKGGQALLGGPADRLIAVPLVLKPRVTNMGVGGKAKSQQAKWDLFAASLRRELLREQPDVNKVRAVYEKTVQGAGFDGKQLEEALRVAAWGYLLADAKKRRYKLMNSYSEYYKAKGNSAASKAGQVEVNALNNTLRELRKFSPKFSEQVDDWFGSDANVGWRLVDWYNY